MISQGRVKVKLRAAMHPYTAALLRRRNHAPP